MRDFNGGNLLGRVFVVKQDLVVDFVSLFVRHDLDAFLFLLLALVFYGGLRLVVERIELSTLPLDYRVTQVREKAYNQEGERRLDLAAFLDATVGILKR